VPDPPPTRIELLGGFRLTGVGGQAARLPSARQQELLAFLVLHARPAPVLRQRIAGALWPDSEDSQALTNLRRELHHLREGWPDLEARVAAGTRTLAWRESSDVDLLDFETAAERGLAGDTTALRQAASCYRGDVLPDCTGEWLEAPRERLRQRARAVLARLIDVLEGDRAFGEAIEHAQQLCRLDPLDERTWCALMRCHARRGDRATALHLYQECAALLKKELGIAPSAATRQTYREILDRDATAPAAVSTSPRAAMYPLVGRSAEWHALLQAWQDAVSGRSRLLLIRGESGIGKSRLAEELIDWCRLQHVNVASARCYPGEGRLAYAPIAAWLGATVLQAALRRVDPACLSDVARLRPDALAIHPDIAAPDPQLESWQRLRFFESLSQAFRAAAPLVLILDDVQWADADTIEWLQYFLRSSTALRCFVVCTARAEEEQDNPPLGRMLAQREQDDGLTIISLDRLDQAATAELAGAVVEHPLDEAALARAFDETEGHPLFIVERGRMEMTDGPGAAGHSGLPRVQAVVAARLALLSDDAKAAAEVAAAVGRDFPFDILARASDLEEDALIGALDELWRRHIVRAQAHQRWDFSHDRIREVAYSGIGPARARLIHRRIAQSMELLFADTLDDVSASIAMHLDRGGQPARAVPFLERAASVAMRVSAYEEAIRCLNYALALLATLPAGRDRDTRELALRSSLSAALNPARGYAAVEVEDNLDRVFALYGEAADVPAPWLWVAFTQRFVLGDLKGTREVSDQVMARSVVDASCRCEAHHAMAGLLQNLGDLEGSRTQFEAALAAYDEQDPRSSALGTDLGVFAHAWYSHTLWLLGDEGAAVTHVEHAIALARRLNHLYSETLAFAYAGLLHQMRGDVGRLLECSERVVALCGRHGFVYYGDWAELLIGWARGLEQPLRGIAIIEAALGRLDDRRARARRPYYMSLLADVCQRAGQADRSSALLDTAIDLALERSDVWWLPALHLQRSALQPEPERAATLDQALHLARTQHSRALEQRILAARTLSRTL
jgi:DNA-binding SARP family transcriptional activator